MARLEDRVAIVTGGATGIGRAIAELFVSEGARVVIGDIQDDLGMEVASAHPERLLYQRADVTVDRDIEALIHSATDVFGQVDVMVNNAATGGDRSDLVDLTASGFESTVRLVTTSVMLGHKYAARQFRAQGRGGSIITTASVASLQGGWAPAAYTASKHAIVGLIQAATAELAPYGIRSNAIAPGSIFTPGSARGLGIAEGEIDEFVKFVDVRTADSYPLGRSGRGSDVANAALFLASDESSWISGVMIPVDGGSTAVALGGTAPITPPGSPTILADAVAAFRAR
ncbi:SDR family oxidoreductase [Subtercola sp. PAMC28395]|uniref:SDR family NAD(P)-dependent oxidoreductase n=1 Tax=Subtercola sp. PAMC28395 TaxID=2846775 RepID=UPI001C0CC2ED|nr:SDR family oxidoreductase [Subtercola sp. PAMC28395]QWT24172.1 SDR family oxidoreductase [Subtercola sp. PAMC28395]